MREHPITFIDNSGKRICFLHGELKSYINKLVDNITTSRLIGDEKN